jgi:hypothetical protein
MKEFEYIKNYYNVLAELGRDVTVGNRKGTITEDKGNYIGVTFHNAINEGSYPCHPTSKVKYLDTFTDLKTLRPKNNRSKQRYRDYLHSDSSLSFEEWLGIR